MKSFRIFKRIFYSKRIDDTFADKASVTIDYADSIPSRFYPLFYFVTIFSLRDFFIDNC